MRHALRAAALLVLVAITPSPAWAWGFAGHRLIMRRAIELLPPQLKPFFEHYREEMIVRVVDPDLWRNVGWEEDPNHFVDFGAKEYGPYPFAELPRDYDAALEKFGTATLRRNGLLPWRANEMFGNLRRAFESVKRGSAYGPNDVVLFSAVLSHYMQDAHQPLHATNNYDGQLTGNDGIHTRFERDLIERYESRLTIEPPPVKPILNARDFAFDALMSGYQLVKPIIDADSQAVQGKDTYDEQYFDALFIHTRPILEQRLGQSISATASAIVGAWERAGRPALVFEGARPVEKVKKPRGQP